MWCWQDAPAWRCLQIPSSGILLEPVTNAELLNDTDKEVTMLVDFMRIHILPIMGPDGIEVRYEGDKQSIHSGEGECSQQIL